MQERLYADGLMSNLKDLYDALQESCITNIQEYLRSVVLEPGLRVVGDDFLVYVDGNSLRVKLGGAIFPNYEVFLAPENSAWASLEIPDADDVTDKIYYIKLRQGYVYSHEYPLVPLDDEEGSVLVPQTRAKVAKRVGAELVISEVGSCSSNELMLAYMVWEDGAVVIEDKRGLNLIKMSGQYGFWQVMAPAVDVAGLMSFCMDEMVPEGTWDGSQFKSINIDTPVNRKRRYAVIQIRWDRPTQAAIDDAGGPLYYKARIVPVQDEAGIGDDPETAEEITLYSLEEHVVFRSDDPDYANYIFSNIRCAEGVMYRAEVYQVSNRFDNIISEDGVKDYIIGGRPTEVSLSEAPDTMTLQLTPVGPFGMVINATPIGPIEGLLQIFFEEYDTTPGTIEIERLCNLAYEGVPKPVYLFGTNHDGYRIKARLVGRGQIVLAESAEASGAYATANANYEQIVVLKAQRTSNIDNPQNAVVIATFEAPFNCVISRAQICAIREMEIYGGTTSTVDFRTTSVTGVYDVDLDKYGSGYVEYDVDDEILAGETVSAFYRSDPLNMGDPAWLTMILYLKPTYSG